MTATSPNNPTLTVEFSAAAALSPDRRVTLEAEIGPENTATPTLADIDAMIARARSGLSARTYQEDLCPSAAVDATGVIRVDLAVLVWPSLPGLEYRLTLPDDARPGAVSVCREERRVRLWTAGATLLELPWRMDRASCVWHPDMSPRDERGHVVAPPNVTLDNARVMLSAPVYGLLTATGTAVGYRHAFSLDFAKFDEAGRPRRIAPDDVPVSVTWAGVDGEEETENIDVEMPACAAALLETCERGGRGVFLGSSTARRNGYMEVAYSACDGSVLGTRRVEEGR